jgi:hypothetical protein
LEATPAPQGVVLPRDLTLYTMPIGCPMRRLLYATIAVLSLSAEASAQRWEASRHGPSVSAGIVAIRTVSDDVNTTLSAIACRSGRASLVLAQFGGDDRAGPTNLRIGDQAFMVVFANDPAMARALGGGDVRASSAPLTRDALMALRTARSIRFPDVQRPLPLTGLAQRWSAIEQACGTTLASSPGGSQVQPSPAPTATAGGFEGSYRGQLGPQSLVIRRRAAGGFDVDIDASIPGCGATVRVIATEQGGVLRSQRAGSEACRITFTRTSTGISTRDEGCSMFHGARCSFTAEYVRQRP